MHCTAPLIRRKKRLWVEVKGHVMEEEMWEAVVCWFLLICADFQNEIADFRLSIFADCRFSPTSTSSCHFSTNSSTKNATCQQNPSNTVFLKSPQSCFKTAPKLLQKIPTHKMNFSSCPDTRGFHVTRSTPSRESMCSLSFGSSVSNHLECRSSNVERGTTSTSNNVGRRTTKSSSRRDETKFTSWSMQPKVRPQLVVH